MFFKQQCSRSELNVQASQLPKKQSKDIGKFIFDFNDDEDSQSSNGQNCVDLHSSTSKLQRLKNAKNSSNNRIMPSLMRAQVQENNYVHQISQIKKQSKFKVRATKTLKNFHIFDLDEQSQIPQQQQKQVTQHKTQPKTSQQNPQQAQKPPKAETKLTQKPKQPQPQPQSQQQQKPTLQQITRNPPSTQLFFNIDSEQQNEGQNNEGEDVSDLTTCGDNYFQVDVVRNNAKEREIGRQLSVKIGEFYDQHNIRIFMMTPIPQGVIFQFEVHKFKNFMKTQYLFWLQLQDKMCLFSNAVNDTLFIQKSVFSIFITPQRHIKKHQKQNFFLGQFVSDLKRQVYTLYDHKNYSTPTINDKVLCTIASSINYVNTKLSSQQIYIPKVVQKKCSCIYNSSLTKNLKKMHKLPEFREMVSKYTTHGVSKKILEEMRELFRVSGNTTKHALVKDQNGVYKIMLLKVQQNRFKIRAGSGITPLQIFCYAILHLQ